MTAEQIQQLAYMVTTVENVTTCALIATIIISAIGIILTMQISPLSKDHPKRKEAMTLYHNTSAKILFNLLMAFFTTNILVTMFGYTFTKLDLNIVWPAQFIYSVALLRFGTVMLMHVTHAIYLPIATFRVVRLIRSTGRPAEDSSLYFKQVGEDYKDRWFNKFYDMLNAKSTIRAFSIIQRFFFSYTILGSIINLVFLGILKIW